MLTAAMGLLLDGPIKSINYNVEQVLLFFVWFFGSGLDWEHCWAVPVSMVV